MGILDSSVSNNGRGLKPAVPNRHSPVAQIRPLAITDVD